MNDTHRHISELVGWHPGSSLSSFLGGYSNSTVQNAVREKLHSRGIGIGPDGNSGWEKVWRVLFYLIRISFGILLIASILLIVVTIVVIVTALNSSRGENDHDSDYSGGGMFFMPSFWIGPNRFWFFDPAR